LTVSICVRKWGWFFLESSARTQEAAEESDHHR
jgi:hypothetical protein